MSVGKPSVPLVLVCDGDGSYFTPFCLDLSEELVASGVQYFGIGWYAFVAHLNARLRTVKPGLHFADLLSSYVINFKTPTLILTPTSH